MDRVPAIFAASAGDLADATPTGEWLAWAKSLPRPRGILVVSSTFWASSASRGWVAARRGEGYDSPSAAELAYDLSLQLDVERTSRRLDRDALRILSAMYPAADVPVLELSLVTGATPRQLFALGKKVAALSAWGYLVMGTGGLTSPTGEGLEDQSARELDAWFANTLADAETDHLFAWKSKAAHAPSGALASTFDHHLAPLFVVAGVASHYEHAVGFPIRGFASGSLSRRCVQFGR